MIEILKKNEQLLSNIKKESERLESLMASKKMIEEGPRKETEQAPSKTVNYSSKIDETFENDVKKYLAIIDSVSDDDNIDEIISYSMPHNESFDKERLIQRLCIEYSKRIKDTKEFIKEEQEADESELLPFYEEIVRYEAIKKSLHSTLKTTKDIKVKKKEA